MLPNYSYIRPALCVCGQYAVKAAQSFSSYLRSHLNLLKVLLGRHALILSCLGRLVFEMIIIAPDSLYN